MTDLGSLPPSVLVKIATLEQACIGLTTTLERSRRDLQRLRIERRDCVPQTVGDEFEANQESERVLGEWARLDAAIDGQIARCEAHEKRLRAEEGVLRSCKQYLHGLPAGARLRVVESAGGDVGDIRARIGQVKDEIARLERMPVPRDDLADKIRVYVDQLAARARPIITGIGDGEALRVLYPLNEHANRVHLTGFSPDEGNPLLLLALVQPERLAERLLGVALDGSISLGERNQRLHALQAELTQARYDEEAAICAAIERGDEVSRSSSAPPWAVLMIEIAEREQAVAA